MSHGALIFPGGGTEKEGAQDGLMSKNMLKYVSTSGSKLVLRTACFVG